MMNALLDLDHNIAGMLEYNYKERFDLLYEHLVEKAEETVNSATNLPDNVLEHLGRNIAHSHTPLSTTEQVLKYWEQCNIFAGFLVITKMMYREFADSDHYLYKSIKQVEFLSNEAGEKIIGLSKRIGS